MGAEIDLWRGEADRVRVSLDTVTAIEKSLGDFTFSVRDLQADASAAWCRRRPGGTWTLAAGRRLRESVDREGRAAFWYLSGAWASPGWTAPVPPAGWIVRLEVGAVGGNRGVAADALTRGAVRWTWRFRQRAALGVEAAIDSVWDGSSAGTDFWIGPRLDLAAGEAQGVTLFARWHRGRNPMGLELDGVLAGFEIVESPTGAGGASGADVRGSLSAGVTGDGDGISRLRLRAASPPFLSALRVIAEVEANALDAPEGGDLWYLYDFGLERPLGTGTIGGWFHHRSNHVLSGNNPLGVTSWNVLEAGHESDGWDAIPEPSRSKWGRWDWRARVGWLASSSFGEDRRWHLRGGVRWSWPRRGGEWIPFVSAALDEGDVRVRNLAAGCIRSGGIWEARIDWIRDEQWFRTDRTVAIASVVARY